MAQANTLISTASMARDRSRSVRARVQRMERDINRLIEQNTVPATRGNSSVARLGNLPLTTRRGDLTERGQVFERIIRGRGDLNQNLYSTDPF